MHRFCDAQRYSPLCPALRASTTSAALLPSIVSEYSLPIHAYEPGVPEVVVCEQPLCEFVGPKQSLVRKVVALDCAMLWLWSTPNHLVLAPRGIFLVEVERRLAAANDQGRGGGG
jgi:hypothetical protein